MNYKEAKKIVPKKEFEIFETIFMNQLSRVPSTQLKKCATLARKLRDKYKDLAKFEVNQIHTRNDFEIDTDVNDRRAKLFQAVIDRVETELQEPRKIDSQPKPNSMSKAQFTKRSRSSDQDRKAIQDARRRPR